MARLADCVRIHFPPINQKGNGGPFDMAHGACDEGVFYHEGQALGSGGYVRPHFGALRNGSWVLGTLGNASVARSLGIVESLPGFYWLVRRGANVAPTGSYRAPRTTIGVDQRGRMMLLEVDGCACRPSRLQRIHGCTALTSVCSH